MFCQTMEEHEADKQRKAASTKQRRQKEANLASTSLLDATRSRNISIALKRFTKCATLHARTLSDLLASLLYFASLLLCLPACLPACLTSGYEQDLSQVGSAGRLCAML